MNPTLMRTRHPVLGYRYWSYSLVNDDKYGWVWMRRMPIGWCYV